MTFLSTGARALTTWRIRNCGSAPTVGFTAALLCLLSATCLSAEPPADLPLTKVVLFNSGLGFFEHQARVDGSVDAELKFDQADINDLLKSLVVLDHDGGRINAVSYPSKSTVYQQLKHFSIDLTSQPTLGELLHQLRGEKVKLDGGKMEGVIVGVELKQQLVAGQAVSTEMLTLLDADRLRSISLESVNDVQLVDEKLNAELREALQLLGAGRIEDKKRVRFQFVGEGRRNVRVGYIRQTPMWKTSYRLVVSDGDESLLQGWAIIENTSEWDWDDVQLTLASGRPVTFEMDLYRPLFVKREKRLPDVPAALASKIYSPALGALDPNQLADVDIVPQDTQQHPFVTSVVPFGPGMGGFGGLGGGFGGGGGLGGGGGGFFGAPDSGGADAAEFDPSQGVVAQATAAEIGEQFQYEIKAPVTLAHRRSAMLPIVDQQIKAEKLSIYTAQQDESAAHADDEHPMRAIRLTNSTDLQLTSGPITVFDGGAYAGDARLSYLRPEDQRLLNYALDIDVRVRHFVEEQTKFRDSRLHLGIVEINFDVYRQHQYRIVNQDDTDRQLIVEHLRPEKHWDLKNWIDPAETTDEYYRFEVTARGAKSGEFVVIEHTTSTEKHDLVTLDLRSLENLLESKHLPADIKTVVREVRDLRLAMQNLASNLRVKQNELNDIIKEQNRIRGNMGPIERNSDLYRRYVEKFTKQEDEYDRTQQAVKELRREFEKTRLQLDQFFPSSKGKVLSEPNPLEANNDPPAPDPFGGTPDSGVPNPFD